MVSIAHMLKELPEGYEEACYETKAMQVEIYFKRLKTIMDFGELPKRRPGSVMAWLNGKMMVALLIEKIMSQANFSPTDESKAEYLA